MFLFFITGFFTCFYSHHVLEWLTVLLLYLNLRYCDGVTFAPNNTQNKNFCNSQFIFRMKVNVEATIHFSPFATPCEHILTVLYVFSTTCRGGGYTHNKTEPMTDQSRNERKFYVKRLICQMLLPPNDVL